MDTRAKAARLDRRLADTAPLCLALFLSLAAGCGDKKSTTAKQGGATAKPASAPAGVVRAVQGEVTARRLSAQERLLKADGPIWADDTVTTAAEASVTIALHHNEAVWTLLGGHSKRVDRSAAWRARKGSAPLLAAARKDDHTMAAGRHSEKEAATSEESARRPAAKTNAGDRAESFTPQPKEKVKPKPKRPSANAGKKSARQGTARKQVIRKQAKKETLMKALGARGDGGTVNKVLGGGGGSLDDALTGVTGVAVVKSDRDNSGSGAKKRGGQAKRKAEFRLRAHATAKVYKVTGNLNKVVVSKVLRRRLTSIRRCYERSLRKTPTLSGVAMLKIVIRKGKTLSVKFVKDSVGDPGFTSCMLSQIRRWRFPVAQDDEQSTVFIKVKVKAI